jgi:Domain of unknown function (DUF4342)
MIFDDLAGAVPGLLGKVKSLLVAGTVKRVVIKNAQGSTFADVPVIVAAIVTILLPVIAGFAAIAALVLGFTVSLEPRSSASPGLDLRNRPSSRE